MVTPATPPTPVPRRSRKRWYFIAGFLLLVVLTPVGLYHGANWWNDRAMEAVYREIEAEDPNWRWRDIVAELKPPPDERNSALQILKIDGLLKVTPFDTGPKWRELKYRNARLTKGNTDELQMAFARLDPRILAEARKLKDLPEGGFAIEDAETPFFQIKLDHVQASRNIMNLLSHDAIQRSHDGDHIGAVESCQALVNTARSMKDQPFLIAQLVRLAGDAIAVGAVEQALGQGQAGDAGLAKLQQLLEEEYAEDGLLRAMRGERAGAHQMYEHIRSGKTSFSELMGANMGRSGRSRLLDLFPGLVLGGYSKHLKVTNEQVQASKLQDAERAAAMGKNAEKFEKTRSRLGGMIVPATRKVSEATQRTQGWLRCAVVLVAVERYRLQHNHWPRSLDEVVKAGLLKEIPKDPYDSKPVRFLRKPTGVIVYAIGPDRADNGGKLFRTGSINSPGIDFGFELWDPHLRGVAPPVDEEK